MATMCRLLAAPLAILLAAAPCTAMVFVWSQLTKGDPNYTLVQVSVNDLIMVVTFAPIVAFLLGVTDIRVPWETLILSVVLYIVIPLIAGALTRRALIARGGEAPGGRESKVKAAWWWDGVREALRRGSGEVAWRKKRQQW